MRIAHALEPVGVGGVTGTAVRGVLRHDYVSDVRARHERLRGGAADARAVVGGLVVPARAVVREGVATVERAVLALQAGQRHLETVRADLRVELVRDVGSAEVPERIAALGERVRARRVLAVVLRILACVRLLPAIGDVLVGDDVVVRVRCPIRAGQLEIHGHAGYAGLVVFARLEPRVELVAGGGVEGDADDLARCPGRVVALTPVDRRAVTLQQELVVQQASAQGGGHARVGRNGRGLDRTRRGHVSGVLIVHRRTRVGLEPGEALLVDDPPAERTAFRSRVFVVSARVSDRGLLDRTIAPALVHIRVPDGCIRAGVVLTVVVQVLVDMAVQPAEPARDTDAGLAVVCDIVGVDCLPFSHGDRLEAHDVVELLVPDAHVVGAGRDALDVKVPVLVTAALEDGQVGGSVGEGDVRIVYRRVVGPRGVGRPLHPVARLASDLTGAAGVRPAGRPVHGRADESEEVGGAAVGWLPQLLAGRARAVTALFNRCLEAEAAVDRRGLCPGARSLREPVRRVGIRVAVLGRVHIGEVGGRTEIVDLNEAVVGSPADTPAERVVVVVDGDRVAGLLFQPDLEASEPLVGRGLLGVGSAVRPGVVLEHEDLELAQRQRVIRAHLGEVDSRGEGSVSGRVVGQGYIRPPHLVVEGPNGNQVPAGRQVDRVPVLAALGDDRRVALGVESQRIAR